MYLYYVFILYIYIIYLYYVFILYIYIIYLSTSFYHCISCFIHLELVCRKLMYT